MVKGTYGQLWAMWTFLKDASGTTILSAAEGDSVIFVGELSGKGTAFRWTLSDVSGLRTTSGTVETAPFTVATVTANNQAIISAPTGGMGQFKGLTQGTQQDKYVKVICKGVQPMYADTYPKSLDSGTDNGWILSCYTGISSCETYSSGTVTTLTILDNVTATETTDCLADPRYLTWRLMTIKLKIDGTQSWYRTDSYWNSSCTKYSSTWGPGLLMSTNWITANTDNFGATAVGQTFVFAYSDGSGVQFNHLSFGTTPPSTNTTAGSGTNAMTTAPTSYTNSSPNMVSDNLCISSDLLLAGTTDTSSLASTITDYSDGYKGTWTISLENFLVGAAGGWRGACMVYYTSQYVQSNINGSVCFAAMKSTATAAGPMDFGASYLMHVPQATWAPPTKSAAVTPSGTAITATKYGLVYSPSAATARIFTSGFYASVAWYQPKYASTYADIARYGKDDYYGSYCMSGSGTTSYFSAPTAGVKLTGATFLAASMITFGAALSLAM